MENPFEQLAHQLSTIKEILLTLTHQQNVSTPPTSVLPVPEFLTVKEAAILVNLAVPTIYGLVGRNEIPFMKRDHSKRLYFSRKELESWIREGRRKTVAECAREVRSNLKLQAR